MKHVYGDTCLGGPALASALGRKFVAWSGGGGLGGAKPNGKLNVSWTPGEPDLKRTVLDETSISGPALCGFGNRLYLAWTGTDGSGHLNVTSSADGENWNRKDVVTLPELSMASPALVSFGGALIIAWTGVDGGGGVNLMSSTDGRNFGNKQPLDLHSIDAGPAMGVLADTHQLHLAFTRRDTHRIHDVVFGRPGPNPLLQSTYDLDGESDIGPGLSGSFGLAVAWADRRVGRINTQTLDSVSPWTLPKSSGDTTSDRPATLQDTTSALIAWSGGGGVGGARSNHQLNIANLYSGGVIG
jgi:hypothetical protein